jgi:hypothetical protein
VDEESKQMLRQILDLQKQQMELLRLYILPPWMRFRFSLGALLIALTVASLVLGLIIFAASK